jgi:hypothetical protein
MFGQLIGVSYLCGIPMVSFAIRSWFRPFHGYTGRRGVQHDVKSSVAA